MRTAVLWVVLAVMLCVAGFAFWWSRNEESETASLPPGAAEHAGVALAQARGCLVCHSLDGSAGIGPSWAGTYGSLRPLQDGSSVLMDEGYLRHSMREPAAQVVQGFENVMVPANLSDAEMDMLIGLFKELGTEKSP